MRPGKRFEAIWPRIKDAFTRLALGERGSGKTAFLRLLAEEWSHDYEVVWIFPEALTSIDWPWRIMTPRELAETLRDEKRRRDLGNMALILDELRILANPRLWAKNSSWVVPLSQFMAVARHLDTKVAMATQLPRGADKALREWSEVIVLRRIDPSRWSLERDKPTRLVTLDKALRLLGHRGLAYLASDEALVRSSRARELVYGVPLPKTFTVERSRYWST